jgi:hypothetical protein
VGNDECAEIASANKVSGLSATCCPSRPTARPWSWWRLDGKRGHLDGVVGMKRAEKEIAAFLAK